MTTAFMTTTNYFFHLHSYLEFHETESPKVEEDKTTYCIPYGNVVEVTRLKGLEGVAISLNEGFNEPNVLSRINENSVPFTKLKKRTEESVN